MPDTPAQTEQNQARITQWQATLTQFIASRTVGMANENVCPTAIPNIAFFRREHPTSPSACLIEPSIVLATQGVKRMWVGTESYLYDKMRYLVTSLDLPAESEVVEASIEQPCVGLALKLDIRLITELVTQDHLPAPREQSPHIGVGVGDITVPILEPLVRLLALLDEPESIPILAPLIQREIHYRLLLGDQSTRLRQIAAIGSQSHRIARVIDWIKSNYDKPLRIEELAAQAHMSNSTLHQHFRQLTAMSPLQYQKHLRLNEARRLMLIEGMDAASSAASVGYESPSQFSREYSRLFGAPPRRDIEEMRGMVTH